MKTSVASIAYGHVLAVLAALVAPTAAGADYPSRPIRYVVGFAPGGINDVLARVVGQKLTETLGQPVIIDNRPGAGGNVAAELVARATPDGYTLCAISTAHPISHFLYPKLNYDLERDLAPVTGLASATMIVVVHPVIPARNVADLVNWARSNRFAYASAGVGALSHLSMEIFRRAVGVEATHVPYKGAGPATSDLLGGQVQAMANAIPDLLPHVRSGRLRALGTMGDKRHRLLPETATFAEQGHPGLVISSWTGIATTAGTPQVLIERLAAEITRIVRAPDVSERWHAQGFEPMGGSPADLAAHLRRELARYGKAVRESGARAE